MSYDIGKSDVHAKYLNIDKTAVNGSLFAKYLINSKRNSESLNHYVVFVVF